MTGRGAVLPIAVLASATTLVACGGAGNYTTA
jgi:hypothetical protein